MTQIYADRNQENQCQSAQSVQIRVLFSPASTLAQVLDEILARDSTLIFPLLLPHLLL